MNSRLSLQQFKFLFFVQSLFALLLPALGVASTNGTATATEVCRIPPPDGSCIPIPIKNTNYPIPSSNVYFVAPNGTANNFGTQASPWSVEKALASAPSNATIVFRGGTYRNVNEARIKNKLTLQPYPHEKVWIKGSIEVQAQDWHADGAIWRKDNWVNEFPRDVGSDYIDQNYPMAGNRDMVYINGTSLKQVASIAQVVPGTFYVDSTQDKLYIGNSPVGKTVEATAKKAAFLMWTHATSNPSNTVIRGLGFAHYADRAIIVAAPNVKLEDNTFVWNGVEGVSLWPESSGTLGVSTDAIVRGNTFSYNGRKGLSGDRANRMLLENNTLSYNNVERFSQRYDAAGVKVLRTDGLIWRNNKVEHNFAIGMWFDISSINAKIVHNTVRYNEKYGIFNEKSHNTIIAANVVYKNATGIHISNATSAKVYNNTIVQNSHNLHIDDTTINNHNAKEIAAGNTWIARNHVVKNNILSNSFVTTDTPDKLLFHAANFNTGEPSSLMFSAINNNGYYRTSSSDPWRSVRWSPGNGASNIVYASIADFKAATGFEANALVFENVANPFFVDEANEDFRLKTGSPAIGKGEALPTDVAQAIGLPAGVQVDLGALQATHY